MERERDALVNFSWAHSFRPNVVLTVSPFYHYNRANYDGDPNDAPVSTTQHRGSQYAGGQVILSAVTSRHNARAGVYAFGQHDDEFVNLIANDGSGASLSQTQISTGHLEALFLEDQYKALSWLTLTAGVRLTHFTGAVSENAASPRLGGAIRIPGLNWVLRGSWGLYYQAPPLSTVSGPLLDYALVQGLGFIPLKGERDQEHLFGLTIPVRGWSFEVNNYHQRARNYFDHNAIGNSNVFFPLTIDGARFYGWEVAVRSPRLFRRGEVYLAYAYAHALGAGAVSGGLTDFSPPASGYFLLDHDQRHTLHAGFNFDLPHRVTAGGNLYYGSGFTDGSSDVPAHLPAAHHVRPFRRPVVWRTNQRFLDGAESGESPFPPRQQHHIRRNPLRRSAAGLPAGALPVPLLSRNRIRGAAVVVPNRTPKLTTAEGSGGGRFLLHSAAQAAHDFAQSAQGGCCSCLRHSASQRRKRRGKQPRTREGGALRSEGRAVRHKPPPFRLRSWRMHPSTYRRLRALRGNGSGTTAPCSRNRWQWQPVPC